MIRRERRTLSRAFRAALFAATGPSTLIGCNGSSGAGPDAGSADGATAIDATLPASDASTPDAFAQGGCYIGALDLEAGLDDESDGGADTCAYYFGCGLPQGITTIGCTAYNVEVDGAVIPMYGETCWIPEDAGCAHDVYVGGEDGGRPITLLCNPCFGGGGRRPAGLVRERAARGRSPLGTYLAAMAYEEDASVAAFERMRDELSSLGAPRELVCAATRASHDEVRHARVMARMARARGGVAAKARVRRGDARDAARIAAENAAEGCVKETFGALLLAWQATHASDVDVARAFGRIARDEARHAALSWALARWIAPQLDAKGRARVAGAQARALRALASGIAEPEPTLARDAGLPTASQARALLAAMTRELALTA